MGKSKVSVKKQIKWFRHCKRKKAKQERDLLNSVKDALHTIEHNNNNTSSNGVFRNIKISGKKEKRKEKKRKKKKKKQKESKD